MGTQEPQGPSLRLGVMVDGHVACTHRLSLLLKAPVVFIEHLLCAYTSPGLVPVLWEP